MMATQRQKDAVYGYVRLNYNGLVIEDIIRVIYHFYLIRIASNILTPDEQSSFMDLLFNRLKQQKGNENIKSISTKLLYRASENDNQCYKFHEICDDKGPTISIISNDFNHVFGGYASQSWRLDPTKTHDISDPNVFLYSIRPNMKCVEFKKDAHDTAKTISGWKGYGPTYGEAWDISIFMDLFGEMKGRCTSGSFEFSAAEMTGATHEQYGYYDFLVADFEVFAVSFE